MNRITVSLAALLLALAGGSAQAGDDKKAAAPAQPAATASPNSVGDEAKKATKETEGSGSSAAQANPGRNSFTEGQAKSGDLALQIGFGAGLVYAAQVVVLP